MTGNLNVFHTSFNYSLGGAVKYHVEFTVMYLHRSHMKSSLTNKERRAISNQWGILKTRDKTCILLSWWILFRGYRGFHFDLGRIYLAHEKLWRGGGKKEHYARLIYRNEPITASHATCQISLGCVKKQLQLRGKTLTRALEVDPSIMVLCSAL